MKSLINGRLIVPDGDAFKVWVGALTFDEKIISIGEPVDGAELIDEGYITNLDANATELGELRELGKKLADV